MGVRPPIFVRIGVWAWCVLALTWLSTPACVFPPWDERPGADDDTGDDDATSDDDDITEGPSTVELLCEKFDECGSMPFIDVEQCVQQYESYMDYCNDYPSFLVCVEPCIELQQCIEFIGCMDECDYFHCWGRDV